MTELDQLVAQMKASELLLETSVSGYQQGSELVKFFSVQVDKVDSQIQVLEGDMLKPFAGEALNDHSRGVDE